METHKLEIGDIGEAMAAFQLSLVFNGETQRESLKGEGRAALDWQLKYPVKIGLQKTIRQVGVQVKAGNSYGSWNTTKNNWRLNLKKEHLANWHKSSLPVLIIWIRLAEEIEVYFKLIISSKVRQLYYVTKYDLLTPATKFEIERLVTMNLMTKHRIPQLNLTPYTTAKEAIKRGKSKFKKIRGTFDTQFGKVTLSNYAIRHLTRSGRHRNHVKDSLLLLPHIKGILEFSPKSIQTFSESKEQYGKMSVIKRKVLFIYRNMRFSDANSTNLYIRFEEVIIYNTDWSTNLINHPKISQSLKLESIYRKEK